MINPAEIPQIPGDMDALAEHARSLTSTGRAFASTGARVHSTWQGLAAVYDAPEAGQLLAATQPVSQVSSTVGANVETVAGALSTYAATVKPIKARLEALRAQAQTFVNSVHGDDDWRSDEGKVNQHNQLLSQVNDAVAQWMDAQRTCANAINAVYGGTHYVADNGDGQRAPNEFGYTRDQLNAALGGDQGLPWGKPEEHDGGLLGDVGDFFVGLKDGFVQAITDLGALVGYANGQWSWSTAGQAWKGLGTFALALGTYGTGLGIALDQTTGVPGFKRGEMGNLLLNAGKSIIAYDQWGKGHNGRAAGMATFNIVSAVVGTKGAGGALRAVGAGLKGAEAGSVVTRVGAAAVRAGDFVARMPTVDELGIKLLNKINIHIPRPNLSFAADGPSLGHHVDSHLPSTRGPDVAPMAHHDGLGGSHADGPSIGDGLRPGHHEDPNSAGHTAEHAHDGPSTKDDGGAGQHDAADGHHGDPFHHEPTDHTPNDGAHNPEPGSHDHTPDTSGHGDHGGGPGDLSEVGNAGHGPLGNQADGSWRGEHGLRLDPHTNAAADRFIEQAARHEPRITDQMRAIERSIDHGRLEGLEYRLKGEDSLKRKLASDMAEDINVSPEDALAGIRDSVRYTLEIPEGNYSHGVQQAVHHLQDQGFENIKFKNTWGDSGYKGINSTWRDPSTGQTFELQFHTPESFEAKMNAHELYEQQRLPGNSPERIHELEAQQREIFDNLHQPPGATDLAVHPAVGHGDGVGSELAPASDVDDPGVHEHHVEHQVGPVHDPVQREQLMDEVQSHGHKINRDEVFLIGRNRDHDVVWLERGNERAGLGHMLTEKRIAQFERAGIRHEDIGDVAFRAATKGRPLGITGKDRVVFEVDYHGEPKRIAVTVGDNGYIVGANPVSDAKKLKPLPGMDTE